MEGGGCPELREGEGVFVVKGDSFSCGEAGWRWLHNHVNVLNATKLST